MSGSALRVEGLAKAFGPTRALRQASLALAPGEIHAIVGENGSGKSTLVKILSGVHRPDAGRIAVGDREVERLATPRAAAAAGIATVFQEVLVVEPRSVLENIWLGTEGVVRSRGSAPARRERAEAMLARLLARPFDVDTPVEALSLSERQACCLARALVRTPRVLILDEATSALDVDTRDRLFAVLREVAADGAAVIFISHRMDEIAEIADRVTVMRGGETVATLERGEATADELVQRMAGGARLVEQAAVAGARERAPGPVVLDTGPIALRPGGAPVEMTIRAGELVGLAGLEGHGQEALLERLWGLGSAAGRRVAYVPRERRAESLFQTKSVRENFALPTLRRDVAGGVIRSSRTVARMRRYVEQLGIVLGDPEDRITTLSGGNQQKVVIARWLATEPELLLLNDPTRGIDLGAKRDLYRLLTELADDGMAIVMVSTEVDELVELMDRVLVLHEQERSAELARDDLDRETLVRSYFGEVAHV